MKFPHILLIAIIGFLTACAPNVETESVYKSQDLFPNRVQYLSTSPAHPDWTPTEIETLKSLWLGSLPAPPIDSSNAVSNSPQAAALGHRLFFDVSLSANGQVACATCHQPHRYFTDDVPRAFGTRMTRRHTMTLVGSVYSDWLTWDGRHDSLWSQALEPLEHPDEHGTTRLHIVHRIYEDEAYHAAYEAIFGPLPDVLSDFSRFPDSGGPVEFAPYLASWNSMTIEDQAIVTGIYVNIGKAIAAYERLLQPGPSRFDEYIKAILDNNPTMEAELLSQDEVAGLRLFMGKGDCLRCHQGPLFTDNKFHNTGISDLSDQSLDRGRADGVDLVLSDPFNCLSLYSNTQKTNCNNLKLLDQASKRDIGAFKTPTLRNISETAPYFHTGQFETLANVLAHYNLAPNAQLGMSELQPLNLTQTELQQLEAFLHSLSSPLATPTELLKR